jgi:hypothetical protein
VKIIVMQMKILPNIAGRYGDSYESEPSLGTWESSTAVFIAK